MSLRSLSPWVLQPGVEPDPGDTFQGLAAGQSPAKGPTHPHGPGTGHHGSTSTTVHSAGAPGPLETQMQPRVSRALPTRACSAAGGSDTT